MIELKIQKAVKLQENVDKYNSKLITKMLHKTYNGMSLEQKAIFESELDRTLRKARLDKENNNKRKVNE